MFLLRKATQTLLEVSSMQDLFDPFATEVKGCSHAGEELQDPEMYPKSELIFPSGEPLPQCWIDPYYRSIRPRSTMVMPRRDRVISCPVQSA